MLARHILLLDQKGSPWVPFLKEYFEDTSSRVHYFDHPANVSAWLAIHKADFIFLNPAISSVNLTQKLKVFRQSCLDLRLFSVGGPDKTLAYDCIFETSPAIGQFHRLFVSQLSFLEPIRVLLVDDEKDIGYMVQEFLQDRAQPKFEVDYTPDGHMALQWLETKKYDIAVLDVKMPILDGRDIYREIIGRKIAVPVIMFFDAISGQEISDIHQFGRPAIVDKGSSQSSMPEMLSLIKKMAYFG